MRNYELVLVLEGEASESERKKTLDTIKKWIGDGAVKKTSEWGKKMFIRPIKKRQEGFYSVLEVETEILPKDLEKKLAMEAKVLRHLLVRK